MYQYARSSNQYTFRSDSALSNDQIAYYTPSVVTDSAHESRKDSYKFISTLNVIDSMRKEGFEPYEVRQTRTRLLGRRNHTRHMVRLRHADAYSNGSEVPEIILLNSHDGTSSYQLLSGFFRFVCSNGLIAGNIHNDIRIRHSGNVIDQVIEGSYRVLSEVEAGLSRIDRFKSITLNEGQKLTFADQAITLRWGERSPIKDPAELLSIHRHSDRKDDLWTVFNTVQENLMRGGLNGRSFNGRRVTTRAINGVNENVRINRGLWDLADKLAA